VIANNAGENRRNILAAQHLAATAGEEGATFVHQAENRQNAGIHTLKGLSQN